MILNEQYARFLFERKETETNYAKAYPKKEDFYHEKDKHD